jgi:hypothetical protein
MPCASQRRHLKPVSAPPANSSMHATDVRRSESRGQLYIGSTSGREERLP